MRYWRIGIGFDTETIRGPCDEEIIITKSFEKVDMVGTVLSDEMVRPRLLSIPVFTIRMNEDLYVKGFSNSSITFNLLNHDGTYDNRFKGGERVWVEVDGRRIYTGNVSLTPGGHPNIFPVTVDTNLLGFDEEINPKIKASDFPNVPASVEGNFGNIIGGTVSDESAAAPAGKIPCYRVDANVYLLAWHPCYALLGAYLEDGTDITSWCTLVNSEGDLAYISYTGTDVDVIWANAHGMISPEITFTKDADSDTSITITLTLHECREVVIHWGDTNETTVIGPVTEQDYPHTYGDTNEYDISLVGDVRHIGSFECSDEPISGDLDGFESLGIDCETLDLNDTGIDGSTISIRYLTSLKELDLRNTSIGGSTIYLENMILMEDLRITGSSITGTTYDFINMVNLFRLYANSLSLDGNLSNFTNMLDMFDLRIRSNSIIGTLASITGLTLMEYLLIDGNPSMSGAVSYLSGMTGMIQFRGNGTAITGDLNAFATMPDLTLLHCYSNNVSAYTTTTLPNWDACDISINDLGLVVAEVNNWLIDQRDSSGGSSTKTLNIGGTNAAPSGPGITAKNDLISYGWTVNSS